MYRTRRQHRYEILRKAGFLPFEAQELSRVPFKVPYMDTLVRERYRRKQTALSKRLSQTGWEQEIKKEYFDSKWRVRTRTGKIKYDVWAMLRNFENTYRAKHPEYESPWEKRRRRWKDFVQKLERTYEKYPRGKIYSPKAKARVPRLRYLPEGGAVEE